MYESSPPFPSVPIYIYNSLPLTIFVATYNFYICQTKITTKFFYASAIFFPMAQKILVVEEKTQQRKISC
jgi:hypothetical protein